MIIPLIVENSLRKVTYCAFVASGTGDHFFILFGASFDGIWTNFAPNIVIGCRGLAQTVEILLNFAVGRGRSSRQRFGLQQWSRLRLHDGALSSKLEIEYSILRIIQFRRQDNTPAPVGLQFLCGKTITISSVMPPVLRDLDGLSKQMIRQQPEERSPIFFSQTCATSSGTIWFCYELCISTGFWVMSW